jgi:hypothetical protein
LQWLPSDTVSNDGIFPNKPLFLIWSVGKPEAKYGAAIFGCVAGKAVFCVGL